MAISELAQVSGASIDTISQVLGAFSSEDFGFLVPDLSNIASVHDAVIDISHEALIRNWPRLSDWAKREASSGRQYIRLLNAATDWRQGGGELYQGKTLDEATSWFDGEAPSTTWALRYGPTDGLSLVHSFLAAGIAARSKPTRSNVGKIFLSYRRADSSHAADRIFENLVNRFGEGNIFYDIDTIPYGADFQHFIADRLIECAVFIAVIGDHWLDARFREGGNKGERRLDDSLDFVRLEIETALRIGVPIIPVLVGLKPMPSKEELPAAIEELSGRNAARLSPGRDFRRHFEELASDIETYIRPPISAKPLWSRIRAALGLERARTGSATK